MASYRKAEEWLEEGKLVRHGLMRKKVFLKLIGSKMTMFEDEKILEVSYSLSRTELKRSDREVYVDGYYECYKCDGPLEESDMGTKCKHCGEWTYHHQCFKEGKKNDFCLQKTFDTTCPHGYDQKDVRTFIDMIKAEVSKDFDGSPASVIHKIIDKFAEVSGDEQ